MTKRGLVALIVVSWITIYVCGFTLLHIIVCMSVSAKRCTVIRKCYISRIIYWFVSVLV